MSFSTSFTNNPIRSLLFLCPTAITTQFSIPSEKLTTDTSGNSYLIIPVDKNDYKRSTTDKTTLVDTYQSPFVSPKIVRVGFSATVQDESWNVRQCLEFLAISSISTGYNVFTPVTVLDFCRPEVTDGEYTTRQGILNLSDGTGISGIAGQEYTTAYEINFSELNRRLIM